MPLRAYSSRIRFLALLSITAVLVGSAIALVDFTGAFAQRTEPHAQDTVQHIVQQRLLSDCERDVREIYGHMSTPPGPDSVCSFSYRVETVSIDTSVMKNGSTDVEMTLNRNGMRLISKEFSVYRDSVDVFTVIPHARTIFRSDGGSNADHTESRDQSWMRDTLIARSQIVGCSEILDSAGTQFRLVHLSPDPQAQRSFGVDDLSLLLDLGRREVRSITMVPRNREAFAMMKWTFSPFHYSRTPLEFRESVARQFLNDRSELASAWREYKLTDNRNLSALGSDKQ